MTSCPAALRASSSCGANRPGKALLQATALQMTTWGAAGEGGAAAGTADEVCELVQRCSGA